MCLWSIQSYIERALASELYPPHHSSLTMPYAGPSTSPPSTSVLSPKTRQRNHVRSRSSEERAGSTAKAWPRSFRVGAHSTSSDDEDDDRPNHVSWSRSSSSEASTSFAFGGVVSNGRRCSNHNNYATSPEMLPRGLAPAVRKKSGELVKPSLKSLDHPHHHHVKSAPATPLSAPKYVHFDSQLEHIKLFLAQQRPTAVSRDGSPDEATETEEDTEYPFPRGRDSLPSATGLVRPVLANAVVLRPEAEVDECRLEGVELSADGRNLCGTVRVRNLCFEKRVVVRFTFDDWQTVSEVAAEWRETLPLAKDDRWGFSVKLIDLLAHIERRQMWFAIRYEAPAVGREIWDNNSGRNYRVDFVRTRPEQRHKEPKPTDSRAMADLRRELDRLAGAGDVGPLRTRRDSRAPGLGGDKTPVAQAPTSSPFSSRYDFGASLRARRSQGDHPPPYFAPSAPVSRVVPGGADAEPDPTLGPFNMGAIVGGMPATGVSSPPPTRCHSAPSLYSLGQDVDYSNFGIGAEAPNWGRPSQLHWPWSPEMIPGSSPGVSPPDDTTSNSPMTSTADTSPSAATPSVSPPLSPLPAISSAPMEDFVAASKRPSMDSGFFSDIVQKVRRLWSFALFLF
jgi:hypothetical protein